jgi:acetate---CoA ligase (ADP-forming)
VIAEYPAYREADAVLRDGATVHLRPVRRDDEAALRAFFASLSGDSRLLRFFSGASDVAAAATTMVDVDYRQSYGLLASCADVELPVGHGAYMTTAPGRAEVAFAVADALQGQGLGTILLAHLAEAAYEAGVGVFVAEVLPHNRRMIEVFRDSGFPLSSTSEEGALCIELPLSFGAMPWSPASSAAWWRQAGDGE